MEKGLGFYSTHFSFPFTFGWRETTRERRCLKKLCHIFIFFVHVAAKIWVSASVAILSSFVWLMLRGYRFVHLAHVTMQEQVGSQATFCFLGLSWESTLLRYHAYSECLSAFIGMIDLEK